MSIPDNYVYTNSHEWLKIEEGTVTVGITDFAQKELTDIVFVELPEVSKKVEKGDPVAVVESVKTASDIYAPIAGEIIEVNEALSERPELINEDAFNKGWIFKIKFDGEIKGQEYLDSNAYLKAIEDGA
ncbi:MAG: glycine cleavage system protein GcvH [Candidatus Aureabacteria bacterium]|nr:glycine cleavage system protein GcvH [Candidatus Auribacterota bacterium]